MFIKTLEQIGLKRGKYAKMSQSLTQSLVFPEVFHLFLAFLFLFLFFYFFLYVVDIK